MIRICHITSKHPVYDSRIFYKQCLSLEKNNYEVYLLAKNHSDDFVSNINIVGLKTSKYNTFNFFYISIYQVLKKAIKIKAKVYHFHDPDLIIAGLILKLFGYKVIYDVHEDYQKSIKSKPYIKSKLVKLLISNSFNIFEKFSSKFFDGLIIATPEISKRFNTKSKIEIRNFPKINIEKIHNKLLIKSKKIKLIYVGGISVIRGIYNMLELLKTIENVELILLGDFESEQLLMDCKMHDSWNKVNHLGYLQLDEMYDKIKEADIGLILLHKVPNYENSLPTKAFDYMASGIPFIMSDFNYWREFFCDSAFYVDIKNTEQIKANIIKLINNNELYNSISLKNALKIKEVFNWKIEESKLIDFYRKIINN